MLRAPTSAADWLLEEGQLVTGTAGTVDAVNLADFAETGGDEHALAVECPVEVAGGAHILILTQIGSQLSWNLRHIFEDELTIIQGPALNLCRERYQQQTRKKQEAMHGRHSDGFRALEQHIAQARM